MSQPTVCSIFSYAHRMATAVESTAILATPDPPAGHKVLSVRHFEATPPANINQGLIDGDVIATTKEEEWVTKKKVELTTTRQIETRVQRQLVLEDGKVVEDSGPIVSTNTTEDTEKQETKNTEHRTTGDDPPGEGWLAIPMEGEGAVVKEVRERVVHSKEEVEELTETEDVKHQGDLSDNVSRI
ncbi:hypothetical protein B566_EDAN016995 [Ephemera danica]|nr:hypothetical protein B566_EDAN016995 [Ephemera danica]